MRIALALPAPPDPEGGAADRCALGLLDGLRSHGVEVAAAAAVLPRAPAPPSVSGVHAVPVTPPSGVTGRLAHLRRPLGDLSRTELAEVVHALAEVADIVHLERSLTAWLDEGTARPAVMALHYRARLDADLTAPWRAQGREQLLFRRLERLAIRRYRWLTATSEPVAASIRAERPDADVTVVPLSLRPGDYRPAAVDEPVAGIIGTAGWAPTDDALGRLTRQLWPQVRARVPEATLRVAGRGTEASMGPDPAAGVQVLGTVASAVAFIASLGVLLYPVGRGSGMKVKVLEAMASGVPVVTTAAGAEGVAPTDGVLVVADDDAFVRAAASLLSDAGERTQRGAAGRATFERDHDPHRATEPLVALYDRILR